MYVSSLTIKENKSPSVSKEFDDSQISCFQNTYLPTYDLLNMF